MDSSEKPLFAAKASRSRAWSPIATATRGEVDAAVEMMPNGMFAREKCDPRGMLNQDVRGGILGGRDVRVCYKDHGYGLLC